MTEAEKENWRTFLNALDALNKKYAPLYDANMKAMVATLERFK